MVLLAGPAGTGKSRLAAEKLHAYLLKYPCATGVALRKTRQSMTNSTVLFLERTIIGSDPRVRHIKTEHRFEYYNGSILVYGGMADEEQREQIRGVGIEGGIDILWMEEAIRFVEDDFNEVLARMRAKAAPWQQIALSTNPGPPSHWIHRNLMLGGMAAVYDKPGPEDNPYNPPQYIENLKLLTGILRQRLWDGLWVQAEGLVYADFDLDNLTDDLPDPELPFELAFDDGYVDPRAILFIQRQPDKILVFDELYHVRHLAERCVKEILERCIHWGGRKAEEIPEELRSDNEGISRWCRAEGIPLPDLAVGSPEAKEMQQRLRLADIPYRSRPHEIVEGIGVVRGLICDGNDYRTLRVHRRNCPNLVREITEGYQYPEEGRRRDGEKPLDGNDHACLVAGTLIETLSGQKEIERVKSGDYVLTRNGYKKVLESGMTSENAVTMTVKISDGRQIVATPNHPVFVIDKGYIPLNALRYGDQLEVQNYYRESFQWQRVKLLFTKALNSIGIRNLNGGQIGLITSQMLRIFAMVSKPFIEKSGRIISALYQTAVIFITKMGIRSITHSKTLSVCKAASIFSGTENISLTMRGKGAHKHLAMPGLQHLPGINRKLVEKWQELLEKGRGSTLSPSRFFVSGAVMNLILSQSMDVHVFARENVKQRGDGTMPSMRRNVSARGAEGNTQSRASTKNNVSAPVSVVAITENHVSSPVYNLKIDRNIGEGEYFANGILLHNCDAFRSWAWMRAR